MDGWMEVSREGEKTTTKKNFLHAINQGQGPETDRQTDRQNESEGGGRGGGGERRRISAFLKRAGAGLERGSGGGRQEAAAYLGLRSYLLADAARADQLSLECQTCE